MTPPDFRLPRRTRRTATTVARIVCPDDAETLGLIEPVVDEFERTLASFPGYIRVGLIAGMTSLELGAVALPSSLGRTFSRLPREKQEAYFASLWHSPLMPIRQLVKSVKALITLAYFEHPTIKQRLEYHPDRWIAETARQRLASFGAEIARHEATMTAPDPLIPTSTLSRKVSDADEAA